MTENHVILETHSISALSGTYLWSMRLGAHVPMSIELSPSPAADPPPPSPNSRFWAVLLCMPRSLIMADLTNRPCG